MELEVESLNRRLRLVEDELEQSRERLQTTQDQLLESTTLADETDRCLSLTHFIDAAAARGGDADDAFDVTLML